ncbi:hypothetical protein [Fuscovulum ytuae]|uniref:Uncharacterized protein n=1 Tax=Fuscovulum ytuae TaxID=3042299 RepID=A0ABY8Q6W1_9RHOB|nr:hypothetical protein [Fuscovulum sp. YMD61]WGV16402.1 hypothetical protein QF092_00895 [Fuscovulum sp. YMD61]
MPLLSPRKTVLLPALLLSVVLPVSAMAANDGGALCTLAVKDPLAFVSHPEFNERLLEMAGTCDDVVLALTSVTGSIPAIGEGTDGGKTRSQAVAPDYSDLVARLEQATAKLQGATEEVQRRQSALDRSIRRAKRIGLKDDDFMLVAVMAMDDDHLSVERLESVLPDFTNAKRRALENVLEAQAALAKANDRLTKATEDARPLVEKAMDLSGLADKTQGNLSDVLGDLSAEEMTEEIRKAIAAAKEEADALASKADAVEDKLKSVEKALKDALNSKTYKEAVSDLADEEEDYAKAENAVTKAQGEFDAAYSKLSKSDRKDFAKDDCESSACRAAKKAEEKLDDAKDKLKDRAEDVEEAKADLEKVAKSLKLAELSASVVSLSGDLDAVQKAEAAAKDAAEAAEGKAKELADLLETAAKALEEAKSASQAAKDATAKEEEDVAAAQDALKAAMAHAADLLDGSEEEAAARQAVLDAQDALTVALAALGVAQDAAADLAEDLSEVTDAPADVTDAGADLAEASKDGDAAATEAEASMDAADAALEAHDAATEDLKAAVTETSDPAAAQSGSGDV